MSQQQKTFTGTWKGRSLDNYKGRNANKAKEMGVYNKLMSARTLTHARKIMRGATD